MLLQATQRAGRVADQVTDGPVAYGILISLFRLDFRNHLQQVANGLLEYLSTHRIAPLFTLLLC
jgi:hypothetical protein